MMLFGANVVGAPDKGLTSARSTLARAPARRDTTDGFQRGVSDLGLPLKKLNQTNIGAAVAFIAVSALASTVYANSDEEIIARAMSAAPSDISANATIMDVDGTILREGNNGWVCLPGVSLIPGDDHPMCNDNVWMEWMAAVASGSEFSTDVVGVSYMLQGDALVNNDNPMATDPNDGGAWVQDGPHVMMLFPNMEMLANLPRDPFAGGPYVMWGETPLAHVMVPIEAKEGTN